MLGISALTIVIAFMAFSRSVGQGEPAITASHQDFVRKLSAAAVERTHPAVRHDPAYIRIPCPGGDVPAGTGVCTDDVIRSYRALGIDLQKDVHEDMLRNFAAYPDKAMWFLAHPDAKIDHRRVPNLIVFFKRNGGVLPITTGAEDYSPTIW